MGKIIPLFAKKIYPYKPESIEERRAKFRARIAEEDAEFFRKLDEILGRADYSKSENDNPK